MNVDEYLAICSAINVARNATQKEINKLENAGNNGLFKDYYEGFLETLNEAEKSFVKMYNDSLKKVSEPKWMHEAFQWPSESKEHEIVPYVSIGGKNLCKVCFTKIILVDEFWMPDPKEE